MKIHQHQVYVRKQHVAYIFHRLENICWDQELQKRPLSYKHGKKKQFDLKHMQLTISDS